MMVLNVDEISQTEYVRTRSKAEKDKAMYHSGPDHYVVGSGENDDRRYTIYVTTKGKFYKGRMVGYPMVTLDTHRISRVQVRTQIIYEPREVAKPGQPLPSGDTPSAQIRRMKRAS